MAPQMALSLPQWEVEMVAAGGVAAVAVALMLADAVAGTGCGGNVGGRGVGLRGYAT